MPRDASLARGSLTWSRSGTGGRMTRTSLTAFLLLASLGTLLALWTFFPGQPGMDAPEPGASPARPASLGPESRPAAPEPVPRALLPEATPLEPDAAEDVSGHCRVRVVQKEGGQPAPGATVFLRRWARLAEGDQEAFLARHGDPRYAPAGIEGLDQTFITDSGGRVALPAPGHREARLSDFFPAALAAARWGELASGFVKLPASATDSAPALLLEVGPAEARRAGRALRRQGVGSDLAASRRDGRRASPCAVPPCLSVRAEENPLEILCRPRFPCAARGGVFPRCRRRAASRPLEARLPSDRIGRLEPGRGGRPACREAGVGLDRPLGQEHRIQRRG